MSTGGFSLFDGIISDAASQIGRVAMMRARGAGQAVIWLSNDGSPYQAARGSESGTNSSHTSSPEVDRAQSIYPLYGAA